MGKVSFGKPQIQKVIASRKRKPDNITVGGQKFTRRQWEFMRCLKAGEQEWNSYYDDIFVTEMTKRRLVVRPPEASPKPRDKPHDRVAKFRLLRLTERAQKLLSLCDMGYDAAAFIQDSDVEQRKEVEKQRLWQERHGPSVELCLSRHPEIVRRGMPVVMGLLREYDRRNLAAAIEAIRAGESNSTSTAFKCAAKAWNDAILLAVSRSRNDLFLEVRQRLPALRTRFDIEAARKAVEGLLQDIPEGTTAREHLLLAERFVEEVSELGKA